MGARLRGWSLPLPLLLWLVAGGCSDPCGDDPSCGKSVSSSANYKDVQTCETVPIEAFVDAAVQAWCTPRPECKQRSRPGDRFAWAGACRAWVRDNLMAPHGLEALVAAVGEQQVLYNATHACTCLRAVLDACTQQDFMLAHAACQQTFSGTALDGARCRWNQQCAGGFCRIGTGPFSPSCPGTCIPAAAPGEKCGPSQGCAGGSQCVAGTCVALGVAKVGALCGALGCETGSYCDWGSGVICKPRLGQGQPCKQAELSCLEGLYCAPNPDPTRTGHTCEPLYAAGAVCAPDGGPDVQTCVAGYACGDGSCQAWAGLGQACAHDAQCPHDALCTEGKCQPLPAKFGKCALSVQSEGGFSCLPPWLCDPSAGHCVSLPGAGEACVQGQCGAGLDCVSGVCDTGPGEGLPCATSGKLCADGFVCIEGKCAPEVCM